jgi:uncharacterized YigZ family protein
MIKKYHYKTLRDKGFGEHRDKGSRFFAHAFHVENQEQINKYLDEIKKSHSKASHHVYAWRLGLEGISFRANDDGEPSGTGGRPILGQIDRVELTNALVVVTRYFGGTLLGTSGLINAYRHAAALAIEDSGIIEKELSDYYRFICDYTHMPLIMDAAKKNHLQIIAQKFGAVCELTIQFPQLTWKDNLIEFIAGALNLRKDQVAAEALSPQLIWEFMGSW